MSVSKTLSWTGWLLVVVYLGALTAISAFIAKWLLFSNELAYYEVFFEVVVSAGILYILTRIYKVFRSQNSESQWWNRGLKILAIIFGSMGFGTFIVGYGLLSSTYEYADDLGFQSLDAELQRYIIQGSFVFGILFVLSSIIAIVATVGLPLHRKFGWYAAVSLILIQIVAVTGLLDKERATYFVIPPSIANQFDKEQVQQAETIFVPLVMIGVFTMIVTNIVIVTFLTLPKILAIFKMPPDILSSHIGKHS